MSKTRFFEDVNIGEKIRTGTFDLTGEAIHEFASVYDPQFIHIDEDKAKEGPFGDIIASGLANPFGQYAPDGAGAPLWR